MRRTLNLVRGLSSPNVSDALCACRLPSGDTGLLLRCMGASIGMDFVRRCNALQALLVLGLTPCLAPLSCETLLCMDFVGAYG
jgi:hypothetical protein